MGLTEGQAFLDKVISKVCRIGIILMDSFGHAILVHRHSKEHIPKNSEGKLHRINRVKKNLPYLPADPCYRQEAGP